jgi:hypothetical protein
VEDLTNMRLGIVIDGKSAEELFAVGPKDIISFLESRFHVRTEDIKSVAFIGVPDENNPLRVIRHKDNYTRPE